VLGIRPEDFEDAAFGAEAPGRSLTAVCTLRESLGSEVLVHFTAGQANLVARVHPQTAIREGDQARVTVDTERLHFFDAETSHSI
jgi:multiple sugar transport system ATP-binding protein